MRIRLKGINSVRKRRADGSVETYYYAWKGGPRIRGELGSPEFIASYNEAAARKVVTPIGTLVSLSQQYQASPDFMDLADSTRRSYVALIKRIEKKFSDFPPGHPFLTGVVGVTFNDLRGTAVTPRGAKAVRRPRFSVGGRENYRTMFRLRHFIERRLQGGADWNGQHRGRDRNDYRPQPS